MKSAKWSFEVQNIKKSLIICVVQKNLDNFYQQRPENENKTKYFGFE